MRFDQLPLLMIAKQSDFATRGCVVRTNKRMQVICGRFPHHKTIDRVEFSSLQIGETFHNRINVYYDPFISEPCFTDNKKETRKYFSLVCQVGELLFSDMECGNYNILQLFSRKILKVIKRLFFDNCFFLFSGSFLADTCQKYNIESISIVSPSALYFNVQSVMNDEFFCSYQGYFVFAVKEKKDVSRTISFITDQTLYSLAKNPRKVFKLQNVRCQFTLRCLVETVETVIRNILDIDWDLGVLVVGTDELSCFHNLVKQTLAEAAVAINGFYEANWYCICDHEEIYCEEYTLWSERSRVKFTIQLDQSKQPFLRKRPFKSSNG